MSPEPPTPAELSMELDVKPNYEFDLNDTSSQVLDFSCGITNAEGNSPAIVVSVIKNGTQTVINKTYTTEDGLTDGDNHIEFDMSAIVMYQSPTTETTWDVLITAQNANGEMLPPLDTAESVIAFVNSGE